MQLEELWLRLTPTFSESAGLRREVRDFLDNELNAGTFVPQCNAWLEGYDPSFSKKLGERGWLGLAWPKRYGGAERSNLDRYVVIEELLATGAPVAAHWIAERQTGPSLLRFGSEEQKSQLLPAIARGECFVAIGMSEPDSGSDLASVRTSARRVEGGWIVSGAKVWTSHASRSHYIVTLCRTGDAGAGRHDGLSQFIIDLTSPGVEVRPITLMNGHAHFAEVVFDSVFVPDNMLLGALGQGWEQVNAELAYERSGPERFLSTFPLLVTLHSEVSSDSVTEFTAIYGALVAELVALRSMSRSIAELLNEGLVPQLEATMVKDLGTNFENSVVDAANWLAPRAILCDPPNDYDTFLTQSVLAAPLFTLRGGTTEILRGIIAKGLIS
jgi:alkylation response protein AidB-like acyl-CoA dehydrogenase